MPFVVLPLTGCSSINQFCCSDTLDTTPVFRTDMALGIKRKWQHQKQKTKILNSRIPLIFCGFSSRIHKKSREFSGSKSSCGVRLLSLHFPKLVRFYDCEFKEFRVPADIQLSKFNFPGSAI
ncbi:hypothetical protein [Abditibacterium utsteinense]|uniref:hypothetical protein n=1 Tax=Abditibacterium utsteinense TaxID=1960156 RepID=UPI001472A4EE|nr:hypothetical protein [Abditibacterium utsteinense]